MCPPIPALGGRRAARHLDRRPAEGPGQRRPAVDGARWSSAARWAQLGAIISPQDAEGKLVVSTGGTAERGPAHRLGQPGGGHPAVPHRAVLIAVATLDAIAATEQAELREAAAELALSEAKPIPTHVRQLPRGQQLMGEPVAQAHPTRARRLHGASGFADMPPPAPAGTWWRSCRQPTPGSGTDGGHRRPQRPHRHPAVARTTTTPRLEHRDASRRRRQLSGSPRWTRTARIRRSSTACASCTRPGPTRSAKAPTTTAAARSACWRSPKRWPRTGAPQAVVLFVWHTGEELGLLAPTGSPGIHGAARLDRGPAQHRHDRPRRPRPTSRAAVRLSTVIKAVAALHRAGRRRGAGEPRGKHGSPSTTPTMPTASPRLLRPQRHYMYAPVRDSHRLSSPPGPHGLPRGDRRAAVHRLPEDGAGGGSSRMWR